MGIAEVLTTLERANEAASAADTAALRQFIADDYLTINASARFFNKEETLKLFGTGQIRLDSSSYSNRRVRLFGEAVVITHVWHINDAERSYRSGANADPHKA